MSFTCRFFSAVFIIYVDPSLTSLVELEFSHLLYFAVRIKSKI